ncbi:MAG: hypothetical protein ACKV2T_37025 [Kofleriaceae bacterium]
MVAPSQVDDLVARALADQPALGIDRAGFVEHVESLLAGGSVGRRTDLHPGDLALAFACAHQDPAALRIVESTIVPALTRFLLSRGYDQARVDDVLQDIRHRFFVGDADEPPKILAYGGRGPLGAWLRVAALRVTLDTERRHWREQPLEDALIAPATTQLDPLREERMTLLRAALRVAIAALSTRQRAMTRLYYADSIGVDELGRMYRVHASTISRQLAQARVEILAHTRRALASAAQTNLSGVESLLQHAASLELDLHSLLRTHE